MTGKSPTSHLTSAEAAPLWALLRLIEIGFRIWGLRGMAQHQEVKHTNGGGLARDLAHAHAKAHLESKDILAAVIPDLEDAGLDALHGRGLLGQG